MTPDTEATVERVARAIVEATDGPWDFFSPEGQEAARCQARAARAAIPQPATERVDEDLMAAAWKAVCDLSRDRIINSSMDAQGQSLIDSFRESGFVIVRAALAQQAEPEGE